MQIINNNMADVTISQLNTLAPISITSGLLLPVSTGASTANILLGDMFNKLSPVQTVFGRAGNVTLQSSDVTSALGYTPVAPSSPFIAKAWVLFDTSRNSSGGSDTANTARFIVNHRNFTSVTKTSTGRYSFVLSQALSNINCAVIGNVGGVQAQNTNGGIIVGGILTTTTGWVNTWDDSVNSYYDTSTTQKLTSLVIFGD